jgi:hypothetical protein
MRDVGYSLSKNISYYRHAQVSCIWIVCLKTCTMKILIIIEWYCFNCAYIVWFISYIVLSLESKMNMTRTCFLLVVRWRIQSQNTFFNLSFNQEEKWFSFSFIHINSLMLIYWKLFWMNIVYIYVPTEHILLILILETIFKWQNVEKRNNIMSLITQLFLSLAVLRFFLCFIFI